LCGNSIEFSFLKLRVYVALKKNPKNSRRNYTVKYTFKKDKTNNLNIISW
jgi:hypothetical protein